MGDTDPIHLHQHFTRPLQRAQLPPLLLSTRGTSPLNCGVGASTPALVVSLRHSRRRGGRNPSAGWALHVLLRQVLEEQVFSHPSFPLFGELARRGGTKIIFISVGAGGAHLRAFQPELAALIHWKMVSAGNSMCWAPGAWFLITAAAAEHPCPKGGKWLRSHGSVQRAFAGMSKATG